jgi:hypothetical protein
MDQRELTRALRATLWPMLRDAGFTERTNRAAWRRGSVGIDVVEVHAVGTAAEAVGCTTFSFGAVVACAPSFLPQPRKPPRPDGRVRPHYWDCELHVKLDKTLAQPWFLPFADGVGTAAMPSMRAHQEGLAAVVRRDRHDRSDVWFVLEDGSNLAENVADLADVVASTGLPMLERFHDPCAVRDLFAAGVVGVSLDGRYDLDDAARDCPPPTLTGV